MRREKPLGWIGPQIILCPAQLYRVPQYENFKVSKKPREEYVSGECYKRQVEKRVLSTGGYW